MKKRTRLTLKSGKVFRDGPEDYMNGKSERKIYAGSPLDTYDKATRTVNAQRGSIYGHPAVNFQRIANIRAVTRDCADPRARVTLDELAVKMARLVESPYHLESWIDVSGYARAQVMILQREEGYPDYPQDEASGD